MSPRNRLSPIERLLSSVSTHGQEKKQPKYVPSGCCDALQGNSRGFGGSGDSGVVQSHQLEQLEPRKLLAAFVVDSVLDEADGETAIDTTLREAIVAANASTGTLDTITFDVGTFGSGATVTLTLGDLDITDDVIIEGIFGQTIAISGNNSSLVMDINNASVAISDLTITGGRAPGFSSGGGISAILGTVSLTNSSVSGNTANIGNGGGIYANSSSVSLASTTVSGNTAEVGGGIYAIGSSSVTLINSTVSGNTASIDGGGIFAGGGSVSLTNSTVSGNTAIIRNGGGINADFANVSLANTLITGNTASNGDEIYSLFATFSVDANNLFGHAGQTDAQAFAGFTPGASDIKATSDGTSVALSDILNTTLADNGGPTETHALVAGSPALNAGDNTLSIGLTDQRGFARIGGSSVDIGAVENIDSLVVDNVSDVVDGNYGVGELTLREAIAIANADFGAQTITFDTSTFSGGTVTITLNNDHGEDDLDITDDLVIDADSVGGVTVHRDSSASKFRIFNISGSGTSVSMSDLTISGGDVSGLGGGNDDGGGIKIENDATLSLIDSTVSGNRASTNGGGIGAAGSSISVTNSTVSGNTTANIGGGIGAIASSVSVTNSTISGNSANAGGGIYAFDRSVSITNSTVSGNLATFRGGGIYTGSFGGSYGDLSIANSLVAGNSAASGGEIFAGATVTSQNSLLGHSGLSSADAFNGFTPDSTDIVATSNSTDAITLSNILDTTLADNGGPTKTHALVAGSPALDAGDNTLAIGLTDQRGFSRISGSSVDVGAVEHIGDSLVVDNVSDVVDGNYGVGELTLREAITIANADFGAQTITFDTSTFSSGTVTITLNNAHGQDDLDITDDLVIDAGNVDGVTVARDTTSLSDFRIFDIAGASVAMSDLTITGGKVTGDSDGGGISGGGIFASGGSVILTNSTVSGNTANYGGGIYAIGSSSVILTNSTVSGNAAEIAGGIVAYNATVSLANSTVSGNTANYGGGIYAFDGGVILTNSTLSGNTASVGGGGAFLGTSSVSLTNTLISGNTASYGAEIYSISVTFSADANNLFGHAGQTDAQAFYGFTPGASDINATSDGTSVALSDILNTTLADNGGSTKTHALVAGSPALDAGDNTLAIGLTDQRGVSRISGLSVDIGAVEHIGNSLVVDNVSDVVDGNYGVGELTLREAIKIANADFSAQTITFDTSTFSGGTVTITLNNAHGEDDLDITDDLVIDAGNVGGVTVARDTTSLSDFRIFDITDASVAMSDLTITGGKVTGDSDGGGISAGRSSVSLTNITVSGNTADVGGGIYAIGSSSVSLINSTVSDNDATISGGGIFASGGSVILTNSSVRGNTASSGDESSGGGIFASGGIVSLTNSTVSGNTAVIVGGIYASGGSVSLTNSTVSGNTAGLAGGIFADRATVSLANSTVSDNTASVDNGGGIFTYSSIVSLTNSTVSDNNSANYGGGIFAYGGSVSLANTLISGNTATNAGDEIFSSSVTISADANNLFGHAGQTDAQAFVGFTPGTSDIKATSDGTSVALSDILNTTLADNGGPTKTHALVASSPAINSGSDTLAISAGLTTDQRGENRFAGTVDIGAFEVQNQAPDDLAISNNTVFENSADDTLVGTVTVSDVDVGDTHTFSLTNDAGGRFDIDANTGVVTVEDGTKLDHETNGSHVITVQATDSGTLSFSKDVTITIGDVNEAPDDLAISNNNIPENSADDTEVGTVTVSDVDDGDTHTFSLTDDAGGRFDIDETTGVVTVEDGTKLDHETNGSHVITVQATDSGTLSFSKDVTITIGNVNEAPTDLDLSPSAVPENSANDTVVGTVTVTDEDVFDVFLFDEGEEPVGEHTFALLDDAGGRFDIDANTGVVTVENGSLLDHETNDSHVITVETTDSGSLTFSKDVTITITDVNEAPTDLAISDNTVPENSADDTEVGTVTVSDVDDGDTHTFSLTNDAGGRFDIDANTGVVTVEDGTKLDHETNGSHVITVQATDSGTLSFSKDVTITIGDVNEAPDDLAISNNNIPENSADATEVGTVTVSDVDDGDTHTFSLTDDAGGRFDIDATTGVVTVEDGSLLDHETNGSHVITVQATDSGTLSFSKDVTITIGNVNEAPTDLDLAPSTVPENSANDTVVGTVTVTDEDVFDVFLFDEAEEPAGEHTFALTDDAGGRFDIDANTGVVTVEDGSLLDHETNESHVITVETTDSGSLTFSKDVTITISDVNEAPTDLTISDNTVPENSADDTEVGTVTVSDVDAGDTHTFSLTDDAGGRFDIDANTGVVTVEDGTKLDHETNDSHVITVQATDSGTLSFSKDVTITIGDVNETPDDLAISNNIIPENSEDDTEVGTVTVSDVDDGDTHIFSLTDDAGGRFDIDATTGVVTVENGSLLDYETNGSHVITVETADSGSLTFSKDVTITITDVNEVPTDLTISDDTVPENSADDTEVGTVTVSDIDAGDTHTFSLTDDAGGRFDIDANTGVVTVEDGSLLDHETNDSHVITVETTDSGSLTFSKDVTITISDVNEAPTDLVISNDIIPEDIGDGDSVGTITVTDVDAGDTHTFALTDDAGGRFAIDPNTGLITVVDGELIDFDANPSHNITVEVTDSGVLSFSKQVTIRVTKVFFAPTDITLDNNEVNEGAANDSLVGTVAAVDVPGETNTYQLTDDAGGRFAIDSVTGEITVLDRTLIDFDTNASHDITVRATNSALESFDKLFTINVIPASGILTPIFMPHGIESGDTLKGLMKMRVTNDSGVDFVPAGDLELKLIARPTDGSADIVISQRFVTATWPGGNTRDWFFYVNYSGLPVGEYQLVAQACYDNAGTLESAELFTNEDRHGQPFVLNVAAGPFVDLVGRIETASQSPRSVKAGTDVKTRLLVNIENHGSVPIGPGSIDIAVYAEDTLGNRLADPVATMSGLHLAFLRPTGRLPVWVNATFPAGVTPGNYHFVVEVDSGNAIAETNPNGTGESNNDDNISRRNVNVRRGDIDLVGAISDSKGTPTYASGSAIEDERVFALQNLGNVATPAGATADLVMNIYNSLNVLVGTQTIDSHPIGNHIPGTTRFVFALLDQPALAADNYRVEVDIQPDNFQDSVPGNNTFEFFFDVV